MATFAGQPFKFQNVPPEDVFPTSGFMSAMAHFEKFLQVFVANQTPSQRLPKKLATDRVISNNTIHDWIKYSAPPHLMALVCVSQSTGSNSTSHRYREMLKARIEAATNEVQQKPYGETVKYVQRAANIKQQAVNDKATRFPFFNDVFVDAKVVKEGISAASEFIEADATGTWFNLAEPALSAIYDPMFFNEAYVANGRESLSQKNYSVREHNWFVFFQEYSGRIPGMMGVQDLDEGGLVMLAKMSLEFAKCVGYGLKTHNADFETIYQRTGSQGERPKSLDMFDLILLARTQGKAEAFSRAPDHQERKRRNQPRYSENWDDQRWDHDRRNWSTSSLPSSMNTRMNVDMSSMHHFSCICFLRDVFLLH